jgi:hypothetical protein
MLRHDGVFTVGIVCEERCVTSERLPNIGSNAPTIRAGAP